MSFFLCKNLQSGGRDGGGGGKQARKRRDFFFFFGNFPEEIALKLSFGIN